MSIEVVSFKKIVPMVYAYTAPGVSYLDGWTKVGYTESQTVEERVRQQTHTANIRAKIEWKQNAMYSDGSGNYFTDHDFHAYLTRSGIKRDPDTEWFQEDPGTLRDMFFDFAAGEMPKAQMEKVPYVLRAEQAEAVAKTKAYFERGGTEFLWNAKPRFGKTLSAYDLVLQMGLTSVLVVTNRPAIANSWAEDFQKFIASDDILFVSDTDSLLGKPGVYTREEYVNYLLAHPDKNVKMVAFESLQGLKGSTYFGGSFEKLAWMAKDAYVDKQGNTQRGMHFDLLIIDEAHEGVDTVKTERAFENIDRKYTLYLSGTPFKALASERFSEEQIYNWSYADEQRAKANWQGEGFNPYERLPRLSMFTYRLSNMIYDTISEGAQISEEETVDFAFDLNEFFRVDEAGRFVHAEEVKKFLQSLLTNEKYPFSTEKLRAELPHTLWLLDRVASAKALARLLKKEPAFADYEIVVAAGDGSLTPDEKEREAAIDRVRKAIAEHPRTITISVGQLTVGVTIPEWCGVLMLCNWSSPAQYMQAAFRAQNPCKMERREVQNGKARTSYFRKETAYVFDFDPARTLIIFDEFANNLSPRTASGAGTSEERKENIRELLNFFPVIGEDDEGKMVELDAAKVMTIPTDLKSSEVVRHGFMSNFLFQNISNIFGAPAAVKKILDNLTPAFEENIKKEPLKDISSVTLDEKGNVEVPTEKVIGTAKELFGKKVYRKMEKDVADSISSLTEVGKGETPAIEKVVAAADRVAEALTETTTKHVVEKVAESNLVSKAATNRIEREIKNKIEKTTEKAKADFKQAVQVAKANYDNRMRAAETEEEACEAKEECNTKVNDAMSVFQSSITAMTEEIIQNTPKETAERIERNQAEIVKRSIEDDVRAHLRGFSRTIPSFLMAYGNENTKLSNFDTCTDEDVFKEVTGITPEEFRFLRDGGLYPDEETGEMKQYPGHLFNEVVFDRSILKFLSKKAELADYFDENLTEDIFDYIPPQKTNQIFTPRAVVAKMADELERNHPGCFDHPEYTFADLYMKSGLYITEIVKRLYRSEKMKALYPEDRARIRHILENQVYGLAPTEIIYRIATNYILGFAPDLLGNVETHFAKGDAAKAAKEGKLSEMVEEKFFN